MPRPDLPRFSPTERVVHRSTSLLVLGLLATGTALYVPSLSVLVGRRTLLASVHVVCGLLLPVPMALGLVTSDALRRDVAALGRFAPDDAAWLRRRDRRTAGLRVGKFNAGQKVAAACFAGLGLVLVATGLLLLAPVGLDVPDHVREGATFTHDAATAVLTVLLLGHLWQAWRHPEARAALRTGSVDADYAAREHPAWVDPDGQPASIVRRQSSAEHRQA